MRKKTDLELSIEQGMEICVPDLPVDTEPDTVPKQTIELKDGTVIDVTEARIKLLRQRDELRAALRDLLESYAAYVDIDGVTAADIVDPVRAARTALANTKD